MPLTTGSGKESTPTVVRSSAAWSRRVRQLHLYLGIFFAPSIIFFAFSGAFQLFGLHEGHPGDSYQPPKWIAKMASIHKDQTMEEHHGPPPGRAGQPSRPPAMSEQKKSLRPDEGQPGKRRDENTSTSALKWFFLAMAVGLIFTTFLGVYMAFKFNRSSALVWSLLAVGAAIPVALIAVM